MPAEQNHRRPDRKSNTNESKKIQRVGGTKTSQSGVSNHSGQGVQTESHSKNSKSQCAAVVHEVFVASG